MSGRLTYPKFKPSDGGEPPYLAGREMEKQALREPLDLLRDGEGAAGNVIVIGPRGNGKTVLMRWFEAQCEQDETLDAVWLTPDEVKTLDNLANRLAPPKHWGRLPDEVEANARIVSFKWHLDNNPGTLTDLLIARCRKRPLAVLLDEAHTLTPEVGQILLNTSQKVRAKAPFLLILGGTPGLQYRLSGMSASFWNRSDKLGIGLLEEAGARNALLEPFREHGIEVDEDVLGTVIEESQRYPYFLQRWGKALTDVLQGQEELTGSLRRIDADILEEALPVFKAERVAYYEPVREEIEDAGLQPLAADVSLKYDDLEALDEHLLNEVIAAHLQAEGELPEKKSERRTLITAKRRALAGFGYVWRPPTSEAIWHAGIPSLMSHVLKIEKKATQAHTLISA